MKNATQSVSTRPYLIRALFEWCNDNAFTPYIAVKVDPNVQVPKEYVQNGEIVLNISLDATSGLQLGNEFIEFKARFGGVPRQIIVPVGQVIAIYARENGQGMAFPAPAASAEQHTKGDGLQDVSAVPTGKPLTLMTSGTVHNGPAKSDPIGGGAGQSAHSHAGSALKSAPASSKTQELSPDTPDALDTLDMPNTDSKTSASEPLRNDSLESEPGTVPPTSPPNGRPKLTRIK
jgi:stringent starvation protein B